MRKSQFLARLRDEREKWEQALNFTGTSRLASAEYAVIGQSATSWHTSWQGAIHG